MDILKKCVLLLLFLYLANALKTKKQNQTTPIVNTKINNFVEDDIEPKFSLNNNNFDKDLKIAHPQKENSTIKNFDLTKDTKKSVNPKNSEVRSTTKAIQLPIDLLLRHPKINSPKNTYLRSKIRRNVTNINNPIVNYLKPKIDFSEDIMEAVDESIADFYGAIKANNKTNNLEDIKVVDDYVNINMSEPENSEAQIEARTALPDGYLKINTSPNVKTQRNLIETPTTKIEILIKHEPSISNDALRLNSSIVIHNTTYQEITQPTFCPSSARYTPQCPYRWYSRYPCHFYKYPYARCNGHCKFYNNNQYAMPYSAQNTVWKTWSNMDLSMSNPNDINCEEIRNTYNEYANMYEIQDQNI